ncbi:DUF1310 family protein [Streptococcus sp. IMAU 99161]|nr:DUF1310 family protein [Streptococcus sp. IMAU 99161]
MEASKENMRYKKRWMLWLLITSLCLGGCSIFTNKSAQRREMLDIAESKQSKIVLENILRQEDPHALTAKGIVKSYKINKDRLRYNPMGGLTIEMVINNDENLTITTTLTQEDDGHLEQNGVVISGELSKKLVNNKGLLENE